MQEIFLPIKVVRYWQENGHLNVKWHWNRLIILKHVQKCLGDDWFTCTAIKNYKWQLTRAEIRSTVGLTGSHPPGIQKKNKDPSRLLLVSCGTRLASALQSAKQEISLIISIFPASVIPIAFRRRCGCQQKSLSIDPAPC
jgi:hypothetical protein